MNNFEERSEYQFRLGNLPGTIESSTYQQTSRDISPLPSGQISSFMEPPINTGLASIPFNANELSYSSPVSACGSGTCQCTYCGFGHSKVLGYPKLYNRRPWPCSPQGGKSRSRSSSPGRTTRKGASRGRSRDRCKPSRDECRSGGGDADRNKRTRPKNSCDAGAGSRPYANADDPLVCPDWFTDGIFYAGVAFIAFGLIGLIFCRGSSSISDCMGFGRSGRGGSCKRGTGSTRDIPRHLKEQYENFKAATKNEGCLQRYTDKCPGLMNYAGTMLGGSVVSTRDTKSFQNPMLCRCQDSGSLGKLCDPTDRSGDCADCKCDRIPPESIITEADKLVLGKCWAFSGVGKILIRTYFDLVVVGVGIHHPSKKDVIPGLYNSAPKMFEVWGYNSTDDPAPFLFGKFEYKSNGHPSQLFEVKHFTLKKYNLVQFNFVSNYGNKKYTAVYKVEIYGLQDNSLALQ